MERRNLPIRKTFGNALDDSVEMTVLVNKLEGLVQSHLLLNIDMTKPDFDKAAKVVEDYYRNVYIENGYTTNAAFKGKREGK
eukprot:3897010-Amphidinium_carterae.1